jgi:hypothetical protein
MLRAWTSTFLREAQHAAAAWMADGRPGAVRAVHADVAWGCMETWHPSPAAFLRRLADQGRRVEVASSFACPALMPWGRLPVPEGAPDAR